MVIGLSPRCWLADAKQGSSPARHLFIVYDRDSPELGQAESRPLLPRVASRRGDASPDRPVREIEAVLATGRAHRQGAKQRVAPCRYFTLPAAHTNRKAGVSIWPAELNMTMVSLSKPALRLGWPPQALAGPGWRISLWGG